MPLRTTAVGLGTGAAIVIIGTLVWTIVGERRFWPPADEQWKASLHWGLVGVFDVSLAIVALQRWNTWVLPRLSSLFLGVTLSIVGLAAFVSSTRTMTTAETTGQAASELYTDGLYARSRNPQYVGMIVGLVGFVLLVNAAAVAILALLQVIWVVLLPFAEEPWLRERFGDAYERYCDRVPRFVGLQTVRRK